MKLSTKKTLTRFFLFIHKQLIKIKIHLLPVHYYTPVPNIIELKKNKVLWAKKSELVGVKFNLDEQIDNLKITCLPFQKEYEGNKIYKKGVSKHLGQGFGYIEAQTLHAVIRHYQPKRIIEVGSGVSTYSMASALDINLEESGLNSKIYAIEPYPLDELKNLANNNSKIELFPQPLQNMPLEFFDKLHNGDLLFIDSSHTVKVGSDVNYLILEILPRLKKGVIVHFHDIFLPYDYQIDVLQTIYHWNETSLLHAFLINNSRVELLFCLSQLHYDRRNELKMIFPEYDPQMNTNGLVDPNVKPFDHSPKHFPSSIYLMIQ